jgi:broad specificity phosphatase PhoE
MKLEKLPTKTIYFVRHGETDANTQAVFQSSDAPLNESGKSQARLIAERIKKIPFDTLLSSPWPRAAETVKIISEVTGKNPEFNKIFVERIKPKAVEGKKFNDPEAMSLWKKWEKSLITPDLRIGDGENFDDLIKRVDDILTLLQNHPGKEIVVVTHGYLIARIIARVILRDSLTPENVNNFHRSTMITNSGITVIKRIVSWEGEESWRLWTYNDHAHLG